MALDARTGVVRTAPGAAVSADRCAVREGTRGGADRDQGGDSGRAEADIPCGDDR